MRTPLRLNAVQIGNAIWYVVCLIVALGAVLPTNWANDLSWLPVSPDTRHTIRFVVTGLVLGATWIKSHRNLFVHPDQAAK